MKLEEIKRIGPKTLNLLNKIKIKDTNDLVTYYPFRYNIIKRSNLKEAEKALKKIKRKQKIKHLEEKEV